jgi:hypothetical protein
MREVGATYARMGELELRLEALPAPPPAAFDAPQVDPDEDERRSLETLLHSAGVDAAPFIEAAKRLRAA